ncbi:MAG: hypothetical protein WC744_00960 [Patescibacteria group bacterium]|jgi:hypothetical protein
MNLIAEPILVRESSRFIESLKPIFLNDSQLGIDIPSSIPKNLQTKPTEPQFTPLLPTNIEAKTIIVESHLDFSGDADHPLKLEPKYTFYTVTTCKAGKIIVEKININGPIKELADHEFYGTEFDPKDSLKNSPPVMRQIGVGDVLDYKAPGIVTHFQLIKQAGKNSDFFKIAVLTPKEFDRFNAKPLSEIPKVAQKVL